ncbi:MAG: ParA family protein [Ruminococcaceae bacterium]|nr:ParA family protein [Oscillospiraceae bacterium]
MKKITIITGHYGTGKTNIAINLALESAKLHKTVIVDLDIVNPYFRTCDSTELLEKSGVYVIAPEFANSNLDLPSLPSTVASVFDGDYESVIFDVGGDDAGAIALGRYSNRIKSFDYEMYCVISMYRPLIAEPLDAVENMREIEMASRLKITGLINNSSLGAQTTPQDIYDSFQYAQKVSELSGIPLIYTTADKNVGKVDNTKTISLYTKTVW